MSQSSFSPSGAIDKGAIDKGAIAEDLVAQWLITQGWTILARRWTCRMGELDLVASRSLSQTSRTATHLAFVEVKARSSGNWDMDGLLAVNAKKQAKLWQAARHFLAQHPHLAELPCSFDVALVHCRRLKKEEVGGVGGAGTIEVGQEMAIAGHGLTLHQYLPDAFTYY
jgi:putative endonuclease